MDLPEENMLRALVARYAGLRARHGDALAGAELVLPSSRFFPDDFVGDGESVAQLFKRMMAYAPLAEELPLEIALAGGGGGSGGCGTGACGSEGEGDKVHADRGGVTELDDRYRVTIARAELAHPVLLAASLARSVGGLVLAEAEEEVSSVNRGAMSEIAACAVGLGLLVIGGSALYAKGCGGLRMQCVTHLSVSDLAVLLALFVRVHGAKVGEVRAHLDTTQGEAFTEALRWVDGNEALVARLRDLPESLEKGYFPIEKPRGIFGRLFAKREPTPDDFARVAGNAPPKPSKSEAELRRIAETKALVDEALRDDA